MKDSFVLTNEKDAESVTYILNPPLLNTTDASMTTIYKTIN